VFVSQCVGALLMVTDMTIWGANALTSGRQLAAARKRAVGIRGDVADNCVAAAPISASVLIAECRQ
jgi:hypothetical protein